MTAARFFRKMGSARLPAGIANPDRPAAAASWRSEFQIARREVGPAMD